jgi:hypothetical protein
MATEHLTLKPDGSWWRVRYGAGTIQWSEMGSPPPGAQPQQGIPMPPSLSGAGYAQILGAVGQAAGEIGQWWELRQQRLMLEAAHEQTQRIAWLTELMGRWAEVHRGGGMLDLRLSEYLAREARAFVEVAMSNRRIALPQSLLYELDLIQDSFRAVRETLSRQFEALDASEEIDVRDAVREVLPGRALNIEFVRQLALDPSHVWAQKLRGNSGGAFDVEFAEAFRFPEVFRDHLFPSNEIVVHNGVEQEEKHFFAAIAELISGSLPWVRWEEEKADVVAKHDSLRELFLLPAEFSRVRALHSAWQATAAVVEQASGKQLAVLLGPSGVAVQLDAPDVGLAEPLAAISGSTPKLP